GGRRSCARSRQRAPRRPPRSSPRRPRGASRSSTAAPSRIVRGRGGRARGRGSAARAASRPSAGTGARARRRRGGRRRAAPPDLPTRAGAAAFGLGVVLPRLLLAAFLRLVVARPLQLLRQVGHVEAGRVLVGVDVALAVAELAAVVARVAERSRRPEVSALADVLHCGAVGPVAR